MGEEIGTSQRLQRRIDFLCCYRSGRLVRGRQVILHICWRGGDKTRIGVTTSRKVGNAVTRHRIKRWVREIFRRWPNRHHLMPVDIVAHVRPSAAMSCFSEFKIEFEKLLGSLLERAKS